MIEDILCFSPVYQSRVWGGRALETRFGRRLPDDQPYGESWEISARPEADVVVRGGPWEGKRLSELWANRENREAIFGPDAPNQAQFPLLCKILDARDKLSIQVHPPAGIAEKLGGEPKTEAWYIAAAEPEAVLYVGLNAGVDARLFEEALREGRAGETVHALHPKAGDFIFIESGRLHAIGAGVLIYEVQQNSDTTYRVFDWNRLGLDGKPRPLHIPESMQCIDFNDIEPSLGQKNGELLCRCDHFRLEEHDLAAGESLRAAARGRFGIITVVSGTVGKNSKFEFQSSNFTEGDFFMIRHGAGKDGPRAGAEGVKILFTTWP